MQKKIEINTDSTSIEDIRQYMLEILQEMKGFAVGSLTKSTNTQNFPETYLAMIDNLLEIIGENVKLNYLHFARIKNIHQYLQKNNDDYSVDVNDVMNAYTKKYLNETYGGGAYDLQKKAYDRFGDETRRNAFVYIATGSFNENDLTIYKNCVNQDNTKRMGGNGLKAEILGESTTKKAIGRVDTSMPLIKQVNNINLKETLQNLKRDMFDFSKVKYKVGIGGNKLEHTVYQQVQVTFQLDENTHSGPKCEKHQRIMGKFPKTIVDASKMLIDLLNDMESGNEDSPRDYIKRADEIYKKLDKGSTWTITRSAENRAACKYLKNMLNDIHEVHNHIKKYENYEDHENRERPSFTI